MKWTWALVFVVGCGPNDINTRPRIQIDSQLDSEAIIQAIADWEFATDGGFSPQSISIGLKGGNVRAERGKIGHYRYSASGDEWIELDPDNDRQRETMQHELGHWLGVGNRGHVGSMPGDPKHESEGTMHPKAPYWPGCVDPVAIIVVCTERIECGPNWTSSCGGWDDRWQRKLDEAKRASY